MPNNDWYEYTSEEMRYLGEEPGEILGLIMHDREPEGVVNIQNTEPKDALTTNTGKQTDNAFMRQADVASIPHISRLANHDCASCVATPASRPSTDPRR